MSDDIINKVAMSSLETVDLEGFYPKQPLKVFDLKPYLYMELIIKEKEFREALQKTDWAVYEDNIVAVTCSADAVIPAWAYMLVASCLQPYAADIVMGDEKTALRQWVVKNIEALDSQAYADKRIVVKGCGDRSIDDFAYLEITKKLRPVAKSIMYGEPCSTVPIYKKK
ncbi:MAG TPA: DUF2480 family protein [Puia sp.]|nr:DUF2480 family protein [Puia sp.]